MPEEKTSLFGKMVNSFMRLFFRLLYHSFAGTYDLVSAAVSLGRWKQWVHSTTRLINGKQVLELGYGPGHLQVLLNENGYSVFGLDESIQMAKQARRRLKGQGHPTQITRGLAQHLPFPEQCFDSIVATFPTLYIIQPETLHEIQRVLKPGGRLVVLWVAWITGNSFPERVLRAVHQAAHETPPENTDLAQFVEPFTRAGFRASMRFSELPGSRLMFIVASKP